MNTTILMESSNCSEFFYDSFTPNVHYVPVAEDLSDLEEKLAAIESNPKEAREMAERWVKLGTRLLTLDCIMDYVEMLLREYAKLQKFTPEPRLDWPEYTASSTAQYFLESVPPKVETCRPYF